MEKFISGKYFKYLILFATIALLMHISTFGGKDDKVLAYGLFASTLWASFMMLLLRDK